MQIIKELAEGASRERKLLRYPHPPCFSELVENKGLICLRVKKVREAQATVAENKGLARSLFFPVFNGRKENVPSPFSMTQPVIDIGSNLEENLQRWSRALGGGGGKLQVWQVLYSGKRSRWSAKEISEYLAGKLSPKRVTECGKKLIGDGLVRQVHGAYPIVYEKIPEIHHHKAEILRLVRNKLKRESLSTKRASRVRVTVSRRAEERWSVREITMEDVDQLKKARKVRLVGRAPAPLPEATFKRGLQRIFKDSGSYPDWGGENNDFFTNQIRMKGKRYSAAFALKGPGVGVKTIYPGKWGKRWNQIQHLANTPARVFILQSELQIDEDSVDQLRRLVEHRAQAQKDKLFYGFIGPDDSRRLRRAFPTYFK